MVRVLRAAAAVAAVLAAGFEIVGCAASVWLAEDRAAAAWRALEAASPWNFAGLVALALPFAPALALLALAERIDRRRITRPAAGATSRG